MKLSTLALAGTGIIFWATLAMAAPVISIDQPSFSFGSIPHGKTVEHVFTIRNKGTDPLVIKNVRPSCGCTAVSKSSSVIDPGKTGEIRSSFNSSNFNGAIQKTIAVDTNDPKNPISTLTLKGTIHQEIQIDPKQISLGQIKLNETVRASLLITNKGSKVLKITSVTSSIPKLVVETAKKDLNPGESYRISIAVHVAKGDRLLSGYLAIHTDNPARSEILVPVYGTPVM